ncbi:YHS domain-containing protein [Halomicroarcula sp. F13]|uniref:YHS domain-containing protein n=1 Tax=Haloarcula rubra TaxID=2487747 RepID=A0AAW4PWZ8_9EURY|nr:MaoC/PaaZ C-terminal domain-containing protein [Halomicroarcula rubra]MBX0325563.1 YHS domain-containing protein [Halomicroarcula rubra]
MAIDPACGVEVDPTNPGATATYQGRTYVFCSEGCKEHFESDPEQYVEVDDQKVQLSQIDDVQTQRIQTADETEQFELSVSEPGKLTPGDEVTYTRKITEDHVQQFAKITGDSNALHLSEAFAERTRFGERIAHGALVSGLISAALAALPGMTIFLSQDLEFKRPVKIGETVEASCKVVEVIEEDDSV